MKHPQPTKTVPDAVTVDQIKSSSDESALMSRKLRRAQEHDAWNAWWKIQEIESRNTYFHRFHYYYWRIFSTPISWFRENIAEPLQDHYKLPYYHHKFARVPTVDECAVNDRSCIFEANEQYRLDKYNSPNATPCAQTCEDYQENELNMFIKYGEIGYPTDMIDAYMKQKHRMIWERKNPEIMAERARKTAEHKKRLADGDFDMSLWKKGFFYMDKKKVEPPYGMELSKSVMEGDKPLSKDWQYYKKLKEDPDFDPEQGKTSKVSIWPF